VFPQSSSRYSSAARMAAPLNSLTWQCIAGMTNREDRRYQNASGWGAAGRSFAFDIRSKVVIARGDEDTAL
jgi:hypothetical protein